jgi:hypothetical protein
LEIKMMMDQMKRPDAAQVRRHTDSIPWKLRIWISISVPFVAALALIRERKLLANFAWHILDPQGMNFLQFYQPLLNQS